MDPRGFPKWEDGKVHINKDQSFAGVPRLAWNFHIGGYQPAQKWFKDRRGRSLSYDDITQYQKIVKILIETTGSCRKSRCRLIDDAPDRAQGSAGRVTR